MVTKLPAKTQYAYYKRIKKPKQILKNSHIPTLLAVLYVYKIELPQTINSFLGFWKEKNSYAKPDCIYLIKLQ